MKGQKTGGREAGTPNKNTQAIAEMLAEKYPDYHPIIALAEIANDKKQDIAIRLHANKEIAKYICPQLKSIESNQGNDKQKITVRIVREPSWFDGKPLNELPEKKLINSSEKKLM